MEDKSLNEQIDDIKQHESPVVMIGDTSKSKVVRMAKKLTVKGYKIVGFSIDKGTFHILMSLV